MFSFSRPVKRLPVSVIVMLFAAVLGLDQFTKYWFENNFMLHEMREVCPVFNLVLAHNTGAAFSFLAEAGGWQRWAFAALAVIVTVVLGIMLFKVRERRLLSVGLTLIIAGAVGNLIDRALMGYVVDFLDFHWQQWHWPAFNVADIAICVGAGLVILAEFLQSPKNKA